jgi:hypothetical protein
VEVLDGSRLAKIKSLAAASVASGRMDNETPPILQPIWVVKAEHQRFQAKREAVQKRIQACSKAIGKGKRKGVRSSKRIQKLKASQLNSEPEDEEEDPPVLLKECEPVSPPYFKF